MTRRHPLADWVDSTSYSKGMRGKDEPRSWTLHTGEIDITVTRHIHYDGWRLFSDVGIDNYGLEAETADDAKIEAIVQIRAALDRALKSLPSIRTKRKP